MACVPNVPLLARRTVDMCPGALALVLRCVDICVDCAPFTLPCKPYNLLQPCVFKTAQFHFTEGMTSKSAGGACKEDRNAMAHGGARTLAPTYAWIKHCVFLWLADFPSNVQHKYRQDLSRLGHNDRAMPHFSDERPECPGKLSSVLPHLQYCCPSGYSHTFVQDSHMHMVLDRQAPCVQHYPPPLHKFCNAIEASVAFAVCSRFVKLQRLQPIEYKELRATVAHDNAPN
jgi:hypothetical protein